MMRADWIAGHWKRCANASCGRFDRAKAPKRLPAFWAEPVDGLWLAGVAASVR